MSQTRTFTAPVAALSHEEVARWSLLAERSLEPNPYMSPEYLVPASEHVPAARDLNVVVVEHDSRMLAVLPLSVGRVQGVRCATSAGPFVGSNAPLCAPLVDATDSDMALDAFVAHVRSPGSRLPGLVELTLLPGDGALHESLRTACSRNGVTVYEHYRYERAALRRSADTEVRSPRAALSRSRRRTIERNVRQLEATIGPLKLDDRSEDPEAVEEFLQLEAAGWKGHSEGGEALSTVHGGSAWFRDFAGRFRRHNRLQLLSLTAGGRTVYMTVNLRAGRSIYSFRDTYDERYAEHGPGTLGRLLDQEHFLEQSDDVLFDPCIHPSLTVPSGLYPHRRPIVGAYLGVGPAAGALVRAAQTRRRLHTITRTLRRQVRRREGREHE